MISSDKVYQADTEQLVQIENGLVVDKMKLDRFFSVFLEENEMDETDTTTPEWFTYKEMLKEYDRVEQLLTATRYRLSNV